jgi:hypothetical protein
MKYSPLFIFLSAFLFWFLVMPGNTPGQTVIPNADFENWVDHGSYENPQYWDTPNAETATIPFVGKAVVMKSSDHKTGSYSAKLVTENIIPFGNIPGFITLGTLTVDLGTMNYTLTGGVPIYDMPTHLMGFFKFIPQGGDSCSIGLLLTKYDAGVTDTIGYGYYSTHDTVNDWTPFSAWIVYDTVVQPDTMNVMAISSAEENTLDEGTTLYVDDLYLDYSVGFNPEDPAQGVTVYQDRGTDRLMVFFSLDHLETTSAVLYNMLGQVMEVLPPEGMQVGRRIIEYGSLPAGIYVLRIMHDGKSTGKKYFLNP